MKSDNNTRRGYGYLTAYLTFATPFGVALSACDGSTGDSSSDAAAGGKDAGVQVLLDASMSDTSTNPVRTDAAVTADALADTEMAPDACVPPPNLQSARSDAGYIPPGGQCCATSKDCYVDAGPFAGLTCNDSTGCFTVCCDMGYCVVAPICGQ